MQIPARLKLCVRWIVGLAVLSVVVWIIAAPRWVEVVNSYPTVATNVRMEVRSRLGGRLLARRQYSTVSPGSSMVYLHWHDGIDVKLWYTLDFEAAGKQELRYEQKSICNSRGEGWQIEIKENGLPRSWYATDPYRSYWGWKAR